MAKWARAQDMQIVDLQGLTDELKKAADGNFTEKFYQLEAGQNKSIEEVKAKILELQESQFQSSKQLVQVAQCGLDTTRQVKELAEFYALFSSKHSDLKKEVNFHSKVFALFAWLTVLNLVLVGYALWK